MAEMMDITPRSYYAYESGKRSIPTEALVRLNMYTGVDLNEILTGRPSSEGYERVVSTTILMLRVLLTDYKGMTSRRTRNCACHSALPTGAGVRAGSQKPR